MRSLSAVHVMELKMQITNQLFQPLLDRIDQEYRDLLEEVRDLYTEETAELKIFIQKKTPPA